MIKLKPLASALALAAFGASALAQTPMLEEVIVTATKRAESLQDIAVTVTAFSADTIQEANIRDAGDVAVLTPSLNINANISPFSTRITIRGVGTTGSTFLEPSVGTFVDGVSRRSLISLVGNTPVFSKAWYEETGERLDSPSLLTPLGSGPYVVDDFEISFLAGLLGDVFAAEGNPLPFVAGFDVFPHASEKEAIEATHEVSVDDKLDLGISFDVEVNAVAGDLESGRAENSVEFVAVAAAIVDRMFGGGILAFV